MMENELNVARNGHLYLTEKTTANNFGLRSGMAQEIIVRKSTFMEKWALLIFWAILLLLLVGSWFIRYPDIIITTARLTSANAPKGLISLQEGRLVSLFVKNNQNVHKNEMIGWIESTASHEEVLNLEKMLDSCNRLLATGDIIKIPTLFRRSYLHLGEVQNDYKIFVSALQQFDDYMVNGFYLKKRNMLLSDVQYLNEVRKTIQRQQSLTERDLHIAESTFKMDKQLLEEKVMSPEEFRKEESIFINKQMNIQTMASTLLTNEAGIREKQKELDQLNHDIGQQQVIFEQALQSMRSALGEWKRRYVLQSPIEGKLVFVTPVQVNQYLYQGKLIGYINPENAHYYAQTNLPQSNFGKVDTGLKVLLRFDAYPYQEYGDVSGIMDYISNIPSDSGFLATIKINRGLVTSSNNIIPYKDGLQGQALIITRDMRLLERLYYNIFKSLSERKN